MRLAVWSGPRNLSTALMYSFGNRADCDPVDEPFYGPWLGASGAAHPMREAVLAARGTDPEAAARRCAVEVPGRVAYQKHMTHHMLAAFPRGWMRGARHVFLIRHPARVVASYAAKHPPEWEELGFAQAEALFEEASGLGEPVVVEAEAVRADPEGTLRALCAVLGLGFDPAMLAWAAGPRASDGPWAAHWYGAVHRSTGFAPAEGPPPALEGAPAALAERAMPGYERLRARALRRVASSG